MGNDLAAIGIQCQMQLSPTSAGSGAMLLLQPLARAVNLQAGADRRGSCVLEHTIWTGFRCQPQGQAATPTKSCFILRPVRHPELRLLNVMTTAGIVFERHD
ncbi:hypothetical protein BA011_33780 (plasmid) [Rhizobium leguminosarum]|uniref:Uncharacterized protein n=1 Tax=Rhizobium leguminosarum TaxID=384 RepID=A0A1B1CMA5_RHILE|nr:hypothetical protein BA011_33780 [Rhizobium leguminosarum]